MCAARVVSSLDGDGAYFFNLAFLQNGLTDEKIEFQGPVQNHDQEFSFNSGRTFDFVRTAMAKIRDAMTNYLTGILPIDDAALQDIRNTFENLFTYSAYKDRLDKERQKVGKNFKLLIFKPELRADNEDPEDCVARVTFSCNTIKGPADEYTVHTSITSQKFTWFEFQEEDYEAFLNAAFQKLKVDAGND